MARSIERTVVIRCDFCNEICVPLTRQQRTADLLDRAPPGRNKSNAQLDFIGFVPFQKTRPDVCNKCARLACTKLLASIPVNTPV